MESVMTKRDERTHLGDGKLRLNVAPAVDSRTRNVARELRANETEGERVLWNALRSRRLLGRKFRRQVPIGPFVVDFYCAEEQLVVELDGSVHDNPAQAEVDADRQRVIESISIRFLRLSNDIVVSDLTGALRMIAAEFNTHGAASNRNDD